MCTCDNLEELSFRQISFNSKVYNVKICNKCGFVETTHLIDDGVNIYETGHYVVRPYFFIPLLINLADFFLTLFSLKSFKVSKVSTILDFGCGKGYFLYFLKKVGFTKLSGVETSLSRASFASRITGLEISSEFYYSGPIMGKSYDCVSLIHVLEHIKVPFDFLDKLIGGAVNDKGVVYIEVPNINSVASKIAGVTWAHFTPHFHTNHFTIESFKNYCQLKNYEYKLVGTFSFYNSAMGMTSALLFLLGYRGSIFEDLKRKKIIVIFLFLLFLPISLLLESFIALFANRGSVIKFAILNKQLQ